MHFDRELKKNQTGDDVRLLHMSLVLLDLEVPSCEGNQARFGVGTAEVVTQFQRAYGLEPSGIVDPATSAAIDKALDAKRYMVTGTVRSPDRAGVGGLNVQIVDKNLGRNAPRVEAFTGEDGHYQACFSASVQAECRSRCRPDNSDVRIAGDHLLMEQ